MLLFFQEKKPTNIERPSKVLRFDGSVSDATQDQGTFNQQCFMRDADGKIESPNL